MDRSAIYHYFGKKFDEEYHHLSLWYFVAFIFGIIAFFSGDSYEDHSYVDFSIITLILLVIFTVKYLAGRNKLPILFLTNIMIAFIFGICVGNIRMSFVQNESIKTPIITEIIGIVEESKPTTHGMQVTINDVLLEDQEGANKIRLNISKKLFNQINHGDKIRLRAKLFPLQGRILPGSYDFGFYMKMSGIRASGYALTEPEIIEKNMSSSFLYIQYLRQKIYSRLIEILGDDRGNFAAAILIGETKAMPKHIAENMRNSGIAHILSVSGLHLSLVAMIFFVTSRMLLNISNFLAYNFNVKILAGIISIIGSFCYLKISGSNIAATRAFIMTFIFIVAMMKGRAQYPLRSIIIAAFFILLLRPEYIFHPSFQLSFSAVLCLISGYEFFTKYQYLLGGRKGIMSSVKFYIATNIYSSFLASIVTTPFVIYHFYKFATYSVIMNLIAVPLMSFFMMPLAILSLMLMPFSFDKFFLEMLGFFISIIITTANYIISLPGAIFVSGYISHESLILFTIGFFWVFLWKTEWRFLGIIAILASLIMMGSTKKPDFIYDHKLKAVAMTNKEGNLEIYSSKAMSQFTLDYWKSWWGQKEIIFYLRKIGYNNHVFYLPSGKIVSLDYFSCQDDVDVKIITSKKLQCPNYESGKKIITNDYLMENNQVLLFFP